MSAASPIDGALVTTHDEVFDSWLVEIDNDFLVTPFEVVHVDAHADLGNGDAAYTYILSDLLHRPPEERFLHVRPERRGLGQGNFLAFAIACRWVSSLTYVYPPGGGSDELKVLFRDHDPRSGFIEMPCFLRAHASVLLRGQVQPVSREPSVPYRSVRMNDFRDSERFDFATLCVSPEFSPPEAESLIEVVADYIAA